MTAYHTATIGSIPRSYTAIIRAEHQLDRFISDHFWFTYAFVCGTAFTIIGLLTTLSVT